MKTPLTPTRRTFLKTLGAAGLTAPFFARNLHAAAPSRVLRHASFGSAGMAFADIQAIMSNDYVKLVAVAEVDLSRAKALKEKFPDVRVYQDWRVLLDKEGRNLDSVNVSTPDHMHAPIAFSAMQLGKHCYCQKPLAHDIHETRVLTRLAREKKLVTQMGIQIHSYKVYRQAVALVQSGVIGKVKEVHTWSSKKWGDTGRPPQRSDTPPKDLNWDLWLGVAADRPFVGDGYYHPGNWRKRLDFGTGTFGDMGCHIFDPVFAALALTAPISVRSEGPAPDAWNWAVNARIRYVFPRTPFTAGDTVPVTWYDGDERPPAEIRALIAPPMAGEVTSVDAAGKAQKRKRGEDDSQGSIIIGTGGVLHVPHIGPPRLFPVAKFSDFKLPDAEQGHHWSLWADACLNGTKPPSASFDYSGPLTESVLLGSVAVRFPQTTLQWNAADLRFENEKAANAHLRHTYRKGWEIAGL
ncbi:MAG: Gfo/Idh/MocA family oxidoreductase [Opitutaceae bacterium]|nr:Gfo/Idh/MocA family oxidoreductase [Opitutaceae bacterium]